MTQGNTSYLRFSLEESVWFRKGQEVAELLSISLEPNVTIQEQEQYVAIRGSLELTGEYRQVESDGESDEDEMSTVRYVQVAEEREGDCYVFQHYFPVDITIPTNRVNSLHELDVNVDSFDYVLPENNCLKLSADLTVTGVRGQESQELQPADNFDSEAEEEQEEEKEEALLFRSSDNQSSNEIEFAEDDEDDADDVEDEEEYPEDEESYTFSAEARKQPEEEAVPINIAYQANNFFSHNTENEPAYRSKNDDLSEKDDTDNDYNDYEDNNPHPESSSSPAAEYEEEVKVEQDKKNVKMQSLKQKTAKGKGISLAEFFGRRQENEEQAKLKVCFVQQGDSVESIAERYEVSVQQLLKVNHLEAHEEIHEGQVLYIPTTPLKPVIHKR